MKKYGVLLSQYTNRTHDARSYEGAILATYSNQSLAISDCRKRFTHRNIRTIVIRCDTYGAEETTQFRPSDVIYPLGYDSPELLTKNPIVNRFQYAIVQINGIIRMLLDEYKTKANYDEAINCGEYPTAFQFDTSILAIHNSLEEANRDAETRSTETNNYGVLTFADLGIPEISVGDLIPEVDINELHYYPFFFHGGVSTHGLISPHLAKWTLTA